jgi:RHH-type transcriptional regulator, proline utilization regulon repressor / proline dehydrogenase / delta 1-pyrroline-5-carboxylate dehydrogenase
MTTEAATFPGPFAGFAASIVMQSPLRAAITAQTRSNEGDCVARLLETATLPSPTVVQAEVLARRLVTALRAKGAHGAVEGIMREYALSSDEGVALMCLAEALLRIPDRATRDALIRDKTTKGDWQSHVGHSPSMFVNAATWGLLVTGKLVATNSEVGLAGALARLIARGGEPVVRKGVDIAMRMLGEQFVSGRTIAEALANSRRLEARGFRYSYDMLGEAALTAADASRYYHEYERAIHAIGASADGRGLYRGPGISIKLSALHPRYCRAQRDRVMAELLPRLQTLAVLARRYDIGLNIDAEEADRLELSLDLLEALCFDGGLSGWNGVGFVVQAYQKRAPFVIDFLIDLARRSGHRLMIRLVKGAYWDSEIKRAQVDGLGGFPVFTRKAHTDVCYLACARKLLAAPAEVFPQFATHNAYTTATIYSMAGGNFQVGQYEFQCLHGMGEPLYEEVVGPDKLDRPCRIYAPVGSHETLLAYLVRRLLENGANSSFVNRIQDPSVSIEELVADPVAWVASGLPIGAPHPRIALPRALFGAERANSAGVDLANEQCLEALARAVTAPQAWSAAPMLAAGEASGPRKEVRNPADHRDLVGYVTEAVAEQVDQAVAAARAWDAMAPKDRAACLFRGADLLETRMAGLIGLIVREAGKTFSSAAAEVREAVDFLRYYAAQVRDHYPAGSHTPLGIVACISPWNFPLSIFTGQVAAALAAGNAVLAKPAEETPLIAAQAMAILRETGVPAGAVQLLPGDGEVGARLVADPRVQGVMFTGSTDVARLIQRQLAGRLTADGSPVPLIAETGGQNALVVDSSALVEQLVIDVVTSAFDSAGQRCSALRVLCLQEDVADRVLAMLKGALEELRVGNPDRLATDVGPVISAGARDRIFRHVEAMRRRGRAVHQCALSPEAVHGTFVPPTIIEIESLSELEGEVFGPVLHVVRVARNRLEAAVEAVNATGYGLTFGVHSRIDETIGRVIARSTAGNIYVNRNLIGAVVGVQPFGGHSLSGTGPKAGGPLYLRRLMRRRPAAMPLPKGRAPASARAWLALSDRSEAWREFGPSVLAGTPAGVAMDLRGPVGERNEYSPIPRGAVVCIAPGREQLLVQVGAALATGNRALIAVGALGGLPPLADVLEVPDVLEAGCDVVLFAGSRVDLLAVVQRLAGREGPIVPIYVADPDGRYPLEFLVRERCVSVNTAAAGGNASLMTIG